MTITTYNNGQIITYDNKNYYDSSGNLVKVLPFMVMDGNFTVDCAGICKEPQPIEPVDCTPFSLQINATTELCEYTLIESNPVTELSDNGFFIFPDDSVQGFGSYQFDITGECGTLFSSAMTLVHCNYTANSISNLSIPYAFTDGGYIEILRVYKSNTDMSVDLDISPTGSNLIGLYTVNAMDLYFNSLNPTIMQTALEQVIKNAIYNQIGLSANYFLYVTYVANRYTIFFHNKNNPSGIWVGIKNNDGLLYYFYDGVNAAVDIIVGGTLDYATELDVSFDLCQTFRYYATFDGVFNIVFDYNSVTYSPSLKSMTISRFSVLENTCPRTLLEYTTDCNVESVVWLKDDLFYSNENNPITNEYGLYTLNVTCDNECNLTQNIEIAEDDP